MLTALNAVDRAVRALAPVDAVVSLAARRLLSKRKALACGIYCGRFCDPIDYMCDVGGGLHRYLVDWYAQDSFQPCPHDCGYVVGCCN